MDLNQANTGSDLCESKLLNKCNKTSGVKVDAAEIRAVAAKIKGDKAKSRKNMDERKLKTLNI